MGKTKNKSKLYGLVCVIMLAALLFLGTACGETTKTFTLDEGLTITLPSNFSISVDQNGYSIKSREVIVDVMIWSQEELLAQSLVFETTTAKDFATYCAVMDKHTNSTLLTSEKGWAYYSYTTYSSENQDNIYDTCFVVKEKDKFFTIDMYCFASERSTYSSKFMEWMNTAQYEQGTTTQKEEKEFTLPDLTITLSNSFADVSDEEDNFIVGESYSFTYELDAITETNQEMTAEDYAQEYAGNLNVNKEDDLVFVEFTATIGNGINYKLTSFYFKGEENFYTCSFMCPSAMYNQTKVVEWAKTITLPTSTPDATPAA